DAVRTLPHSPASESRRPRIFVWDMAEEPQSRPLGDHETTITQLAYSPDNKWLASVSFDQTIKVWNIQTNTLSHVFHDQAGVYGVDFSPDSLRLATASGDGTVKVWSLPDAPPRTINVGALVGNVAFNRDGTRLAGSCYGNLIVWDAASCRELWKSRC